MNRFRAAWDALCGRMDAPRLLVKVNRRIPSEFVAKIEAAYRHGRTLVIEPGVTLYQIVDGQWQPIDGPPLEAAEHDELAASASNLN